MTDRLVLASGSPRRAELLRAAGIEFEVRPPNVDDSRVAGEEPHAYVRRLAEAKASAVAGLADGGTVLAGDTIVLVDQEILVKPLDAADARRMLRLLSGRRHEVVSAVCIWGRSAGDSASTRPRSDTQVVVTVVEFKPLTVGEIEWYVGTGEPMDKAGAYAIQGFASRFVTRIEGSYTNVVGLPVEVVYDVLRERGWRLTEALMGDF
jgi:septum formation protein